LVSPYRDLREEFKKRSDVREIYVHTKEIRGREDFHVDYEEPIDNFIDIDTSAHPADCLNKIKKELLL